MTIDKPLRDKLGDEGVESLVKLFNHAEKEQKVDIIEFVEEKFERRLAEEYSKLSLELRHEISNIEIKLSKNDSNLEINLSKRISNVEKKVLETKSELIKWMFIFWVGQVGMLLGILFAFFKK